MWSFLPFTNLSFQVHINTFLFYRYQQYSIFFIYFSINERIPTYELIYYYVQECQVFVERDPQNTYTTAKFGNRGRFLRTVNKSKSLVKPLKVFKTKVLISSYIYLEQLQVTLGSRSAICTCFVIGGSGPPRTTTASGITQQCRTSIGVTIVERRLMCRYRFKWTHCSKRSLLECIHKQNRHYG